jgi:hypothetical protein
LRSTRNLEGQVTVLMSLSDRVAELHPQALGSLIIVYDSQGYGGGILTRLHTGNGQYRKPLIRIPLSTCSSTGVTSGSFYSSTASNLGLVDMLFGNLVFIEAIDC